MSGPPAARAGRAGGARDIVRGTLRLRFGPPVDRHGEQSFALGTVCATLTAHWGGQPAGEALSDEARATVFDRYTSDVKTVLRALGLRRERPPWVVAQRAPTDPEPLGDFALFGLVVTWMDADVVDATVRNAFTQGCDRVFLVDQGSADDTVARARAAGAELALSYERNGGAVPDGVVRRVSERAGHDHIWWMWLDGDEFLHGPGGATVREVLAGLDRSYRIVGSRCLEHFPDGRPAALHGYHPLDLQPLCEERAGTSCPPGHGKHPLQRWDRGGPPITCDPGAVAASADVTLVEPEQGVYSHRFPYRDEATTRARAEAGPADAEGAHRLRALDAVYAGRWELVDRSDRPKAKGVHPRRWDRLAPDGDQVSARWYDPADLATAIESWRAEALTPR